MEIIADDLLQKIICKLSIKERLILREVNNLFKTNINSLLLRIYKLEYLLSKSHPVVMKLSTDLIYYTSYNKFTIFKSNEHNKIHPLFNINRSYDTCIVDSCRREKLGFIYYSRKYKPLYHQLCHWEFYNERNIPYCSYCYYIWNS